jgi:hypothetical protein
MVQFENFSPIERSIYWSEKFHTHVYTLKESQIKRVALLFFYTVAVCFSEKHY